MQILMTLYVSQGAELYQLPEILTKVIHKEPRSQI